MWESWKQKLQQKWLPKLLKNSVCGLLFATALTSVATPTAYAETINAARGSTVVLDGALNVNTDVWNKYQSNFAAVTMAPETVKNFLDWHGSESTPFSKSYFREHGYDTSAYTYFQFTSYMLNKKVKWDKDSTSWLTWVYGGSEFDAPSFNRISSGGAKAYAAVAERWDEDGAFVTKNDVGSFTIEYAIKVPGILLTANNYGTVVANANLKTPGIEYTSDYYDYNVVNTTSVFPASYEDAVYAEGKDIAQLCPWYQTYDSSGNMSIATAQNLYNQYKDTKYLKKDQVNALWTQLSGGDTSIFMNSEPSKYYGASSLRNANTMYNWTVIGNLYDYYETKLPTQAYVQSDKNSKPSYTEKYGVIDYTGSLSSTWQMSADDKTWYTVLTNSSSETFEYNMLTQKLTIGGQDVTIPTAIKDNKIWYFRRISTAAGVYATTTSPSMKLRPFLGLNGIDVYSNVEVVEGNYLDPKDITVVAHYSSGDQKMSGKGSYISYPGATNLRITIVGDNWVYYVYNDPLTGDRLTGYFKVKGIQKSPVSMTAEYVGDSVVEQTEYDPKYVHINVVFNNGTIDTFTADSGNVGIYKEKYYGRGDVDGNGVLNLNDASLIEGIIAGQTATLTQKTQADLTGDGKVTTDDLSRLNKIIDKKVTNIGINTFYAAFSGLKLSDGSPKYARFTINGVKKSPYSLSVITDPLKTLYIEGENFKPEGMVLKVLYDNGESQYITYGTGETAKTGVTLGDNERPATNIKSDTTYLPIYYTENGKTVSTEIKIKTSLSTLTSIKVTRAPDTTVYYAGESFKNVGMNVTAYFDEGVEGHKPDELLLSASEYILSNNKSLKDATEYIVLKLDDPTSVADASGDYVRIAKTLLVDGQDFADGASGTYQYKDGKTAKGTVCGNHLVKISYTNRGTTKETYQPIYVNAKKPTALTIVSMPYTTEYTAGQDFNRDGLVLRVAYSDGSSAYIYAKTESRAGYEILNGTGLQTGQNYVIAQYTENGVTLQIEVPIVVVDPNIDGITAEYLGPSVFVGNVFDSKDVLIIVSYSNGTTKSFRANTEGPSGGTQVRMVKPKEDGTVDLNATETRKVDQVGDNQFAACYSTFYSIFTVEGVGKADQLNLSGSVAKSKRMYDTWTENFTAVKIRSVADYINGRVDLDATGSKVNKQTTTDTRQYLTSEEGTGQGIGAGSTTVSPLLSFLREGTWRQPETVISLSYKGRTKGYLYPETTNPDFAQDTESALKYITKHGQTYDTPKEELQAYDEEGWSDWVTNGDSVGTSEADRVAYEYRGTGGDPVAQTMLLDAVKIKLDNVTGANAPKLNVTVVDAAGTTQTYDGISEDVSIMYPAQIKINLGGTVQVIDAYGNEVTKPFGEVYKVYYRASTDDTVKWSKGGNDTEDGEWAGYSGQRMQCLEIKLMLADADFNVGSATSAPVITNQPKSVSVKIGQNATFSVSAIGNDLYYQWYCNGVAIDVDGNSSVYSTPELSLEDSGNTYYCMVIAENGTGASTKSDTATATVKDQVPVLIKDLDEMINCSVGDEVTLSVEATCLNPADLTYEWQITKGGSYTSLAGGEGNQVTFTVTPDMQGQYIRCRVSNTAGSCLSNPCKVVCVSAPVVTITSSEPSEYVTASKAKLITFTAEAESQAGGDLSYKWSIDGVEKSTSTNTITWIPSVKGTHEILCEVTDIYKKTGTGKYTIYVGDKSEVSLASSKTKELDGTWTGKFTATVNSYDTDHLSYVWSIDGVEVTSETTGVQLSANKKVLTLIGLPEGTQKSISLKVKDTFGENTALSGINCSLASEKLTGLHVNYKGSEKISSDTDSEYTFTADDIDATAIYGNGSTFVKVPFDQLVVSPAKVTYEDNTNETNNKVTVTVSYTEQGITVDDTFEVEVELKKLAKEYFVTYDANSGYFDGDTTKTQNKVGYIATEQTVTKTSKTKNVNENGSDYSGSYGDSQANIDTITIPGATELKVTITYATEGTSYDWAAVYAGDKTPSNTNYNESISGKLGGTTRTTKIFTVPGDTVKIYFRSDSSSSSYFGYYATIEGTVLANVIKTGKYKDPQGEKEFVGWYTEKECTNAFDINTVTLDSDVTVYAQWRNKEAYLKTGSEINAQMKTLATSVANITDFIKSDKKPSSIVLTNADCLISTSDSNYPVYMWYEDTTMKWWSEAQIVFANANMSNLFKECSALTDISGVGTWDTSKVVTMAYLLSGCTSLENIDVLQNWKIESVTNLEYLFEHCEKITNINALKNWNVSKVTTIRYLLSYCTNITDISALSTWDISNVNSIIGLFNYCENLSDITAIENWNTSKVTNISYLFTKCTKLTDLSALAKWNTANVKSMGYAFQDCIILTNINALNKWDVSNVTYMGHTFRHCESLTDISALANWNTSKVTGMDRMFLSCSSLENINALQNWDVKRVTNMSYMFQYCSKLTDASGANDWDINNVTDFLQMCYNCPTHPDFTKKKGAWDSEETFVPWTGLYLIYNANGGSFDSSSITANKIAYQWLSVDKKNTLIDGSYKSPVNGNKILAGWYTTSSCAIEANIETILSKQLTADVTVYAKWTNPAYTVTYNANGGYFGSSTSNTTNSVAYIKNGTTNTVSSGSYQEPKKNSNAGFDGWYLESTCINKFNIETATLTSNITVYAKWKERTATLLAGSTLNTKMKTLAGNTNATTSTINGTITAIQKSSTEPSESIKSSNYIVSTTDSNYPIYMWYDNGVIKWWSEATTIYANSSLRDLCNSLQNLQDISGLATWNTSNTTNLFQVFNLCKRLTTINGIKNWDVSKVTTMQSMFSQCVVLTNISELSNWNTASLTSIWGIFNQCYKLSDFSAIKNWNVSKVTTMRSAFSNCQSMTNFNAISNWNMSSVTNTYGMFNGCISITNLNGLSGWNVSKVTDMRSMFYGCTSLSDASGINNWNITTVKKANFKQMFTKCPTHPTFSKRSGTWNSSGTFTPSS